MSDPSQDLAAQYLLARCQYPDADVEKVVDVIIERWGREGALTLASEALTYGQSGQPTAVAAREHVRQFVYAMEEDEEE